MSAPRPGDPLPSLKNVVTSDQSGATETQSVTEPETPIPAKIGHYQIRRRIATGGMGAVYEATQENPRRSVAVKVMRRGITSRSAMRRFEYEAQLLARLEHRGIAQVFEAGTYDDGSGPVPFFAMEYIPNAKRITEYVHEKGLDVRERINLLAQVCDAVQHGHQKGVIHRDLKPANILIDSHGQVKVIDFGVARSTDSDLAVTTLQTDVGQLIGTLQYMSPEQCEADPGDLDTRSDVYALGVILYEILCHRRPYDLTGMAVSAATNVIRQFQPPRPSAFSSSLRGDVETIILKALEKDRDRRYRSAGDLGDDLRRYLKNEPIHARPASVVYQVRVFARRHRLGVGAAAGVLLAVTGGLAVSTLLYLRAEGARQESEAVTRFLHETLASVDPLYARGPGVTVLEMLDDAAAKIPGAFDNHPLVEAALQRTIGNSYASLEQYAAAESHLRIALGLRRRQLEEESVEVSASEHDLARTLQGFGRIEEAETLYRRALATRQRILGNDHADVAETLNDLASCLFSAGQFERAEPLLREALAIRRKRYGEDNRKVVETLDNVGAILQFRGEFNEAIALHLEALTILRKLVRPDHISIAYTLYSLGSCAAQAGDKPGAERYLREALSITTKLRDNRHEIGTSVLSLLARVLQVQGKPSEAEPLYREALQAVRDRVGDEHADTARGLTALASCLRDRQDFAEAEEYARQAFAVQRRLPNVSAADLAETLLTLGTTLSQKDDPSGAEPLLREAVEKFASVYGSATWRTADARRDLGECFRKLRRMEEAERELTEAHRVLSAAGPPNVLRTVKTVEQLAALYETWDAAEPGKGYAEKAAEWRVKLKTGE